MGRRKIKDLIAEGAIIEVQDGNHGEKHPTAADYVESGIPFLMARDFHDGQIDLERACKIPKSLADSLRIGFARTGDVLLTHKGSIGLVAIIPHVSDYVMLTPQVTYYRTNPTKLVGSYLRYALQSPFFRQQLNSFSAQSTRPYIGITAQKELELEVPSVEDQVRIAEALSAYDDLIENNQRRIRILEEMARALYLEWFVEFRFPGHGDGKMSKRSGVNLPFGWDLVPMPKCVEINPHVSVPKGTEVTFIPMAALTDDCMLITESESRAAAGGSKFQNGDTLFARITPCLENGKTGFVQLLPSPEAVAMGSTEFIVLRSGSLTPEFVYCLARSEGVRNAAIASMSGASGRQRVQEKCFDAIQVACPPSELLDRFSAIVAPSFKLIQNLFEQSQRLRKARDLLLPRLLAGASVAA